eukprot:evm.model.scf_1240.2 EVM.evm.TU.scf_1240.2   scf_1240:18139-31449(+)
MATDVAERDPFQTFLPISPAQIAATLRDGIRWANLPDDADLEAFTTRLGADPPGADRSETINRICGALAAAVPREWRIVDLEGGVAVAGARGVVVRDSAKGEDVAYAIGGYGMEAEAPRVDPSYVDSQEEQEDCSRVLRPKVFTVRREVCQLAIDGDNLHAQAVGLLPQGLRGHSIVACDGQAWIFGGKGEDGLSGVMYRLDHRTRYPVAVAPRTPPPSPRAFHASAASDASRVVYVYGGLDAFGNPADARPTLHKYNTRLSQWGSVECVGRCPPPASILALFHLDRRLVAIVNPSSPGRRSVELMALDLKSCEWERVEAEGNAPEKRSVAAVAPLEGGYAVVYGGCGAGGGPLRDVHLLDLEAVRWVAVVPAGGSPEALLHAAAVPMKEGVLLYGGVRAVGEHPKARAQLLCMGVPQLAGKGKGAADGSAATLPKQLHALGANRATGQHILAAQHCRLMLASCAKSLGWGVVAFKTEKSRVVVPAGVLGLYTELFDDVFLEALRSQPEVEVSASGVPPAALAGLLRWTMGLVGVQGMQAPILADIFRAADRFSMPWLQRECLQALKELPPHESAGPLLDLAEDLPHCEGLAKHVKQNVRPRLRKYLKPETSVAMARVIWKLKLKDLKAAAMNALEVWGNSHPVDVLVVCYDLGLHKLKSKFLNMAACSKCPDTATLREVVRVAKSFECPDALKMAKDWTCQMLCKASLRELLIVAATSGIRDLMRTVAEWWVGASAPEELLEEGNFWHSCSAECASTMQKAMLQAVEDTRVSIRRETEWHEARARSLRADLRAGDELRAPYGTPCLGMNNGNESRHDHNCFEHDDGRSAKRQCVASSMQQADILAAVTDSVAGSPSTDADTPVEAIRAALRCCQEDIAQRNMQKKM